MKGRILLIGELIATGGIGLHGDIITTTALGGQALSVPTLLSTSIQPTRRQTFKLDPNFIGQEIDICLGAPGVDAIKLGALDDGDVVHIVSKKLHKKPIGVPLVVCPVLTTEEGSFLLNENARNEFKERIIAYADVLVVNILDAELLSGIDIIDVETMCEAAHALKDYGCKAILITGGLLSGEDLHDVLISEDGEEILTVKKHNIHRAESYRFAGGWALATAIATSLGQGFKLKDAINRGRQFVDKAIGTSFNADESYQNLNLAHTIHPFVHDESTQPYTVIPGKRFRSFS